MKGAALDVRGRPMIAAFIIATDIIPVSLDLCLMMGEGIVKSLVSTRHCG